MSVYTFKKNSSTQGRYMYDMEANGLLDTVDKWHCGVFLDIDTEEMHVFDKDPQDMLRFMENVEELIAHYCIGYDLRMLKKLFGWTPPPNVVIKDSLVISRLLNPDRSRVQGCSSGPHSVEAWGRRLGRWKPDHTDWTTYSPEMLHRCKEDVHIQWAAYQKMLEEASCNLLNRDVFNPECYTERDWSEAMILEHKSAAIMQEQEANGCYFDKEKAEKYVGDLTNVVEKNESDLHTVMGRVPSAKGVTVTKPFKSNGMHTAAVQNWMEDYTGQVFGPFTRVAWNEVNIGSPAQVKKWLYSVGWEPDEWNFSTKEFDEDGNPLRTSPKLSETSLVKIPNGLGEKLILRNKARHRRSQIEGWISRTRDDHRIPAAANSLGTPTGRMTHISVANVPSCNVYEDKNDPDNPRNGSLVYYPEPQETFFGTEMRDLFRAAPSRVLVGRDASGLELRCFAHFLNNPDYIDVLLSDDIHVHNQHLAGLPTRAAAKRFIYAFLYGAGRAKLGSILIPDGTEEQMVEAGERAYQTFLNSTEGLQDLIKGVKKASKRGWLKGLDGRKLNMRKQHGRIQTSKSLNTLLQGAGAQVMTYARTWLWDHPEVAHMRATGDAIKVLDYHDEETYECTPHVAEDLRELMIQSVREAGEHFNFRCPLDADAKIGATWANIH